MRTAGRRLTQIAILLFMISSSLLFLPIKPNISFTILSIIVIFGVVIQTFFLGVFSIRVRLKDHPVTIRQALLVGLLSLFSFFEAFASIYRYFGILEGSNGVADHNSLDCLYFSIVTWTTLGYGDFRPSPDVRMVAAVEALIGYVGMVALLGIAGQYFFALAGLNRQKANILKKKMAERESGNLNRSEHGRKG